MELAKLKEQQTQLVLQRAQAKDVVENVERVLGQIGHTIQVLEAAEKAAESNDTE